MEEDMLIEDVGLRGAYGQEEDESGLDQDASMENGQGEEVTGISQEPPTSVIVTNLTNDTFDDPDQRVSSSGVSLLL